MQTQREFKEKLKQAYLKFEPQVNAPRIQKDILNSVFSSILLDTLIPQFESVNELEPFFYRLNQELSARVQINWDSWHDKAPNPENRMHLPLAETVIEGPWSFRPTKFFDLLDAFAGSQTSRKPAKLAVYTPELSTQDGSSQPSSRNFCSGADIPCLLSWLTYLGSSGLDEIDDSVLVFTVPQKLESLIDMTIEASADQCFSWASNIDTQPLDSIEAEFLSIHQQVSQSLFSDN